VAADGTPADAAKAAYPHSFVVLAASSATVAGRPGAADLLDEALDVVLRRFWDEDAGRTIESWDRGFTTPEPYRGANSSMHMVEAFLAAGDATGDPAWATRALRVCEHLVHTVAAEYGWRLPEHFTPDWRPLLEYNADRVADPFRPYGTTIGHWLEWSRLLLHLHAALAAEDGAAGPPRWLVDDARALFAAAVERGWAVDGADGFVYTLDWTDRPVVRSRMHWVLAEAIAAAAALAGRGRVCAVRRRRRARLGGGRRGRLRLHAGLGRPAGGALPDALGTGGGGRRGRRPVPADRRARLPPLVRQVLGVRAPVPDRPGGRQLAARAGRDQPAGVHGLARPA